jgi:four helix bundle protein
LRDSAEEHINRIFLRFLINSLASNNETIDHLENLYNTESLTNKQLFTEIHEQLEILGRKLNNFINAVQIKHNINIVSEPESNYQSTDAENLEL